MMRSLKHLLNEERLVDPGLFSLGKKRLSGDLITVYKYLLGGSQMDRARLLLVVCTDRTRGMGKSLLQGTCFRRGLDSMISRDPFLPLQFCDSVIT